MPAGGLSRYKSAFRPRGSIDQLQKIIHSYAPGQHPRYIDPAEDRSGSHGALGLSVRHPIPRQ